MVKNRVQGLKTSIIRLSNLNLSTHTLLMWTWFSWRKKFQEISQLLTFQGTWLMISWKMLRVWAIRKVKLGMYPLMSFSNWERIWKHCKKLTALTIIESKEISICWKASALSLWRTNWMMTTKGVKLWSRKWRRISRTSKDKLRSWIIRLAHALNPSRTSKVTSEMTTWKEKMNSPGN